MIEYRAPARSAQANQPHEVRILHIVDFVLVRTRVAIHPATIPTWTCSRAIETLDKKGASAEGFED